MKPSKFRWSKVYESSEEELVTFLQARNISAQKHDGDFGDTVNVDATDSEATLWCAEGSFNLDIEGISFSMQPGDAIRIPVGSSYIVTAGISGFSYYLSR